MKTLDFRQVDLLYYITEILERYFKFQISVHEFSEFCRIQKEFPKGGGKTITFLINLLKIRNRRRLKRKNFIKRLMLMQRRQRRRTILELEDLEIDVVISVTMNMRKIVLIKKRERNILMKRELILMKRENILTKRERNILTKREKKIDLSDIDERDIIKRTTKKNEENLKNWRKKKENNLKKRRKKNVKNSKRKGMKGKDYLMKKRKKDREILKKKRKKI